MKALVVEDEKLTAQRLVGLIKKYDPTIEIVAEIGSIEEATAWFQEYQQESSKKINLDLIFMDVHLEDGDCFQLIKRLNITTPMIFTTAFDEYMIKAFKVNSIDYLLKPISYEELTAAIDKFKAMKAVMRGVLPGEDQPANLKDLIASLSPMARDRQPEYRERFMVSIRGTFRSIETKDIAFFYVESKGIFLTTFDETIAAVDYTMDALMQMLDPKRFFRANRQYMVSFDSITAVHNYGVSRLKLDIKPKSRHDILINRERITAFKDWFGK